MGTHDRERLSESLQALKALGAEELPSAALQTRVLAAWDRQHGTPHPRNRQRVIGVCVAAAMLTVVIGLVSMRPHAPRERPAISPESSNAASFIRRSTDADALAPVVVPQPVISGRLLLPMTDQEGNLLSEAAFAVVIGEDGVLTPGEVSQ